MFRYHTAYESLRRERMKLGIELFRYVGVFQDFRKGKCLPDAIGTVAFFSEIQSRSLQKQSIYFHGKKKTSAHKGKVLS